LAFNGKTKVLGDLNELCETFRVFSRLEKVWKIEVKSGKMVKSLEFFSFQSYNKCFISEIFFVLVKSYSISPRLRLHRIMKKALFLRFLRSLSLAYLITLSPEKEIIVLEKSMEKVLNYRSKNLYEPWNKRHSRQAMVGNKDQQYYFSILGANLSNWRIQQCRFHWT